jgi:hypothetical protein
MALHRKDLGLFIQRSDLIITCCGINKYNNEPRNQTSPTLVSLYHCRVRTFPHLGILMHKKEYHSWGYTQKTVTQVTPEAPAHPCLLQHYSQ